MKHKKSCICFIGMILMSILASFVSTSCNSSQPPQIDEKDGIGNFRVSQDSEVKREEQLSGYRLYKKHINWSGVSYYFELEKISDLQADFRMQRVTKELYLKRRFIEGYEFRMPYMVTDTSILNGYKVIGKWAKDVQMYEQRNGGVFLSKEYYLKIQKGEEVRDVKVTQVIFESVQMDDKFPLPAEREEKQPEQPATGQNPQASQAKQPISKK
jgi:hypothetical protein